MPEFDFESLISPLQPDAPCGNDLEYDPAFLALEAAGTVKGEQQFGETIIPAVEPDWPSLHQQALQLAGRTRDLRIAVWLVRSGARVGGLVAAVAALELTQQWLDRFWEHVHPQLDASEHDDPTARLNALAPLADAQAGLRDWRAAALTSARGSLRVRDIELALGPAEAAPGEPVPSEDGVIDAIRAATQADAALEPAMQRGVAALAGISRCIEARLGAAVGPDLGRLKRLLQRVADGASRARGVAIETSAATSAMTPAEALAAATPGLPAGALASREDVLRSLDRACLWIERHEPTNPAPLLIRRAQRLMGKSFIDIIRDLAPDGLSQVENLAGVGRE